MTLPRLSWVVPVHNDERVLEANVARLVEGTRAYPAADIHLVENGSRDRSWEVCQSLAGERDGVAVRAHQEPNAGIGYAYARGLREVLAMYGADRTRWAILTASDLPFGFTDLEAAVPHFADERATVLAGSKAHPESEAFAGWKRKTLSSVFRAARRVLVGMKTRDSQGSFFLRLDAAAKLAPQIQARDFFYTTELTYHAERMGGGVREIPVRLEASQLVGATTVRPLHDGSAMLASLFRLRLSRGRPRDR
jgi:glycosyltransferase involved in cell wall biosynthesis